MCAVHVSFYCGIRVRSGGQRAETRLRDSGATVTGGCAEWAARGMGGDSREIFALPVLRVLRLLPSVVTCHESPATLQLKNHLDFLSKPRIHRGHSSELIGNTV